jgi:predicted membrane-bound mannosyltransferase/DNA-binding beta-propeller fold protein YncE
MRRELMAESTKEKNKGSALDRIFDFEIKINFEIALVIIIVLVAILTRFYDLETRVMSHDESLHTYYSWRLKEFQDYRHTPLMHGPFQFHLIAFSYFIFGDSDASARIPFAIIGVASILLMLVFRKWLGKWGVLIAMLLMLISPYMLYYQRYVRNEAIVVLLGMLMFWSIFEYFENRQPRWLFILAVALSLHHATKETSFIYAAQLLLFLGIYFAWKVLRRIWALDYRKWIFILGLVFTIMGVIVAGWGFVISKDAGQPSIDTPVAPLDPTARDILSGVGAFDAAVTVGFFIAIFGLLISAIVTIWTFGKKLRTDFPSLDLLIVTGTLTLPLLAAFPARVLSLEPFDGQSSVFSTPTGLVVLILLIISAAIGLAWDWRRWSVAAAAFFGIFILFYTNIFTNGNGISSGLVRSLGYWLEQHGVKRGGQPLYYYLLIQIPIYEYLPTIGALIAGGFGITSLWHRIRDWLNRDIEAAQVVEEESEPLNLSKEEHHNFPVMLFLGYWAIFALGAYSLAGERMPWLTVHIILPLIFLAAWGIQRLIESSSFSSLRQSQSWLAVILLIIFGYAFLRTTSAIFSPDPPFGGNDLVSLRTTSLFIGSATITLGSFIGLVLLFQNISSKAFGHLVRFAVLGSLAVLTMRTALRASFLHPDLAIEYLVYAHAGPGVKTVLSQIEEFSERTTGGLAVDVAYDDDVSWPYTWYFRNFSNTHYYADNPTRELLEYPLILAGNDNWSEVESIIGNRYISSEFIRMWWPNQDYFRMRVASIETERRNEYLQESGSDPGPMTFWEYIGRALGKITPFFTDPDTRKAVWQIWLNRDFSYYGQVTDRDLTLEKWSPSDRMRFYIRRDVAELLWDYGYLSSGLSDLPLGDPYEQGLIDLNASLVIGINGEPITFNSPRGVASATDGSVYVADSGNHRIIHLSTDGSVINQWGSFGQEDDQSPAPPSTFSEPWGIAVAPDGDVYVADTWNHRVQRFSAEGEYLGEIGPYDEEGERIFWGPRAVAVDDSGRVFIVDTGNHRIAIYDNSGEFLGQFGEEGYDYGQLREPVGIALDSEGRAFVADTWNHRVQVFEEIGENNFFYSREWTIEGWYGESLVNKPYLAISNEDHVCLTDPEGFRALCFSQDGTYFIGWGEYGGTESSFGLLSGIAISEDNKVWIVDSGNNRIMQFEPPLP